VRKALLFRKKYATGYAKLNTEVNFIISLSMLIILEKFQNSSSESQYPLHSWHIFLKKVLPMVVVLSNKGNRGAQSISGNGKRLATATTSTTPRVHRSVGFAGSERENKMDVKNGGPEIGGSDNDRPA